MTKMSIRTGDKVRVIAGKDKGKEGKVLRRLPAQAARRRRARQHDQEGHAPDAEEPEGRHPRDRGHRPRLQRDARVPEAARSRRASAASARTARACASARSAATTSTSSSDNGSPRRVREEAQGRKSCAENPRWRNEEWLRG